MSEIITDRFILRNWKPRDEEEMFKVLNNPRIIKNLGDNYRYPYSIKDARDFIEDSMKKAHTRYAITIDNKIAGSISLEFQNRQPHIASIEGWLGEKYWGQGLMTQVLKEMTQYAFENLKIERIEGRIFTWNKASAKMTEKAGYTFEGLIRKGSIKENYPVDILLYSMIREDTYMR